jgi:hypothetical protein
MVQTVVRSNRSIFQYFFQLINDKRLFTVWWTKSGGGGSQCCEVAALEFAPANFIEETISVVFA